MKSAFCTGDDMSYLKASIFLFCVAAVLGGKSFAQEPMVSAYLKSGMLNEGKQKLERHLDARPEDDQAKFGLGVLHFLGAVDHLGKSWYRYGLTDRGINSIPFLRVPVEDNPAPETIDYQKFRAVFQEVADRLEAADKVLAQVKDRKVKLPIQLSEIYFDFDADGKVTEQENATKMIGRTLGVRGLKKDTVVAFDYSDVQWLRGYTHLLRAICEIGLAYDHQEFWDVTAYRFFEGADSRYQFQDEERENWDNRGSRGLFGDTNEILDIIASIHNLRFKLKDANRLKKAHAHLKTTIRFSREMWELIEAETDNDREWIPNTKQDSSVTQARISPEMVKTWRAFLGESADILDGKKLLPFWRGTSENRGVNLKRFFMEPKDLDIVLWVHGSGASPYVEEGEVTSEADWRSFQQAFGGRLFGFATWFN